MRKQVTIHIRESLRNTLQVLDEIMTMMSGVGEDNASHES